MFKLIDGCFFDYEVVILFGVDKCVMLDCEVLCGVLQCVVIFLNEKYWGVKLELLFGKLCIVVYNLEQEEVVEEVEVDILVFDFVVGFNVGYLLDVFVVLCGECVWLNLCDVQFSCLVQEDDNDQFWYVIMLLCF